MCNLYTRLWYLGQARPELGLSIDTRRAARMWDYMVYTTAPDGGPCGTEDIIACTPGLHRQIDRCGPIDSDAALAIVHLQNGAPAQAFIHQGMILSYEGRSLIRKSAFGTYRRTIKKRTRS